jgi:hypothetical protein
VARYVLFAVALLIAAAGVRGVAQQPVTAARPFVRFEKTRFVAGEPVFFWIGNSAPLSPGMLIGSGNIGSGKVVFTRPDLTTRTDVAGGLIDASWSGGWRLRETPQFGPWVVVFEIAGYRSAPVSFTVENVGILKDIDTAFTFPAPLSLDDPDACVTLDIANRYQAAIRFVQRGQSWESITGKLDKTSGERWASSFFVPTDLLLRLTGTRLPDGRADTFTWRDVKRVPTVQVPSGARYRLSLPLREILKGVNEGHPIPSGDYDVKFTTELALLVGDKPGDWKEFQPIRLPIESTAKGVKRE